MSRMVDPGAWLLAIATSFFLLPACGDPLYQINLTGITFTHNAGFQNEEGDYVPLQNTALQTRFSALPPVDLRVDFFSNANNPTGANDGGQSLSNASSSFEEIGSDNSVSFAIGPTSLSDKGAPVGKNQAPYAGLRIDISTSITFRQDVGPSSVTFAAPSITGSVGPDQGDFDSLTGRLTLSDSADQLGTNGIILQLPGLNDSMPNDFILPTNQSVSSSLPGFPNLDTLTIEFTYNLEVQNASDDVSLGISGGGISLLPEPTSAAMLTGAFLLSRRIQKRSV